MLRGRPSNQQECRVSGMTAQRWWIKQVGLSLLELPGVWSHEPEPQFHI